MDEQRGSPGDRDERLLRLERRVDELERAARSELAARRRTRLLYLLLLAVLVAAFYWELTAIG